MQHSIFIKTANKTGINAHSLAYSVIFNFHYHCLKCLPEVLLDVLWGFVFTQGLLEFLSISVSADEFFCFPIMPRDRWVLITELQVPNDLSSYPICYITLRGIVYNLLFYQFPCS